MSHADELWLQHEPWLQRELPEALDAFRLWHSTRATRAMAKGLALKERHGETLTSVYTEALRMSALLYLTHLGAAQDLIELEIKRLPDNTHYLTMNRLKAKLDRLNALAVEPSEDA